MAKRCYTFSVYITAEEATEDSGFEQQEIERLLRMTLNHYSGPLNKERHSVTVDHELISSEEVNS